MSTVLTPVARGWLARYARWAENRRIHAQRMQTYRRTRRELAWLTNRELADLGLSRYDLDRVARESAFGVA